MILTRTKRQRSVSALNRQAVGKGFLDLVRELRKQGNNISQVMVTGTATYTVTYYPKQDQPNEALHLF